LRPSANQIAVSALIATNNAPYSEEANLTRNKTHCPDVILFLFLRHLTSHRVFALASNQVAQSSLNVRERRDSTTSQGRFGDDEQSSRSRSSRFGFFSGQCLGRRLRRAGPACRGVCSSGAPTGVHGTAGLRSPGLYGANGHLYGTDGRLYGTPGVCRADASPSALAFASNICVRAWISAWMARPLAWVALIFPLTETMSSSKAPMAAATLGSVVLKCSRPRSTATRPP
jgi:hypothetical protein